MKRDYIRTFAAQALVIICYLLTFRLVAHRLGPDAFGQYALTRRTLGVLAPIGILGADFATARFVAYARGSGASGEAYLPAALTVMLTSVGVLTAGLVVFARPLSHLFFGAGTYVALVLVLPLLLLGTGLHSITYGYLRGQSRFLLANALLIVNQAVVPLLSVVTSDSAARTFMYMGAAWVATSVAFLVRLSWSTRDFAMHVHTVLRYGVPRAPGDALQLALFAAPSLVAAHLSDLRTAGIVAFGTSALVIVGSVMGPIEFILLPVSARLLAMGELSALRRHVARVTIAVLSLMMAVTIVAELTAGYFVGLYLGPSFGGATPVLRIMILAALPYALYCTLKSVVDARHIRAINTRNMAAAAVTFSFGCALTAPRYGLAVTTVTASFVVSVYALCALTAWEAAKAMRLPPDADARIETNPEVDTA